MKELLSIYQDSFVHYEYYERMRLLRMQQKFTMKQMAEKCVTTEKAWFNWEKGRVVPRKNNKRRIALVLGVDEEIIFGRPQLCDLSKI